MITQCIRVTQVAQVACANLANCSEQLTRVTRVSARDNRVTRVNIPQICPKSSWMHLARQPRVKSSRHNRIGYLHVS